MIYKRAGSLILSFATAFALVAFMAAPAFAHHDEDHEKGKASEEQSSTEDDGSDNSSDEGYRDYSSTRTTSSREAEPDPEPSQAPPSTKGPGDCGDYSEEENGIYDHDSCDGSQGMHGSDGNEKCAGCTGLADDKSPGGQFRNDHNNGYECDNNGGVGKGNPPHARCPVEPTITELCPENTDMAGLPPGPNGCDVESRTDKVCPPGTDRAGLPMRNIKDCVEDSVLPNIIRRPVTPARPAVRSEVQAGAVLPFTGAGALTTFAALGTMLIALGALTLRGRKHS